MKNVLRVPAFRRLLAGWSVGNFADSVLFLTLAVWAKDLTGSSSAAGLIFLVLAAPVLLAPAIGLLADRMSRKLLLVLGNLLAAVVTATLLLVQVPADAWLLYVVTFAYGTLGYINGSAQGGLVRDMLPADLLGPANSLLVTIDQGLRILTPAVGAALYVLWGGHALALAVSGMLLLAAVLLSLVRVTESPASAAVHGEGGWAQITAGLRHLRTVPLLVRMVITSAVAFGVVGFFDTAMFELVEKGLGMEAAFFGVLMSIQGAGSVVGGLTASTVLRRWGPGKAQGAGLGLVGIAGTAMAISGVVGPALLPVVAAACFVAGMGIPWMVVALITTRQRCTPARLQGRVGAAMNVAMTVPQILSIGAGAALVLVVDYRVLILAAGIVMLLSALSLFVSRLPEPVDIDAAPTAAVDESEHSPEVARPMADADLEVLEGVGDQVHDPLR